MDKERGMSQAIREQIYRVKPLHQFLRWVMYNSDGLFYRRYAGKYGYSAYYKQLQGSCKGKRCFIIGNGPSLTAEDLELLANEDTFASNYIFKLFTQTNWRPKYYVIIDRYLNISSSDILENAFEHVFLGSYRCRFHRESRGLLAQPNIKCVRTHQTFIKSRCKFAYDVEKCAYLTDTVSYIMMQLAVYMGYSEIYLLGFDHTYQLERTRTGTIVRNNSKSHFYRAKDTAADMEGILISYTKMKRVADEIGLRICNATRGGKLEVFERVDLEQIDEW